jgi:hypothetical protein
MSYDTTINYGNVVAGSVAKPAGVHGSYFYARWVGCLIPSVSGLYTIGVNSQDGANLIINGSSLVDNLATEQNANGALGYTQSGQIELMANTFYDIVLEWQHGVEANYELQLIWTPPGGSMELIPTANLSYSGTTINGSLHGAWWNGSASLWYPTGIGAVPHGYQGAWSSATAYVVGDEVLLGGLIYECVLANTNHTPPNATYWLSLGPVNLDAVPDGSTYARVKSAALTNGIPTPYQGVWSSSPTYLPGQEVTHTGSYWTCLVQNTNSAPSSSNTNWQQVGATGSQFLGAWNSGTAYVVGNQVTYGSPTASYYVCIADSTNNEPDTNPTYWQQIGSASTSGFLGAYQAGTSYVAGDQVTYQGSYWICISATTGNAPSTTSGYWTLVGTSAIMLGAYDGGTAYVQGNQVTYNDNVYTCILASTGHDPTNGTYWTLIGPSTLDAVADGSTYARHKADGLTNGYSTKTWDGSATHTIKGVGDNHTLNLDSEVADGTTYGRPLATRLSSGKPLIDFSESIHLNKSVDNIADGSSYKRVAAADITSGHVVKTGASGGYTIKGVGDTNALSLDTEVADGSTYARVKGSALGSGIPVALTITAWAGSTVYVVGQRVIYNNNEYTCTTANSDASWTAGHWQLLGPATLDALADGSTYARTVAAGLSSGYATKTGGGSYTIKGVGDNHTLSLDTEVADGSLYIRHPQLSADETIPNATFCLSSDLPPIGWTGTGFSGGIPNGSNCIFAWDTTTPYGGNPQSLKITTSAQWSGISCNKLFAVTPGDSYTVVAYMKLVSGSAGASVGLQSNGMLLNVSTTTTSSSWSALTLTATIPANAYEMNLCFYGRDAADVFEVGYVRLSRNRSLDTEVLDGTTYGRPLASRLSSGKPLIDFSESIHLNKTLDNIADGTTYVRITSNEKIGAARSFAITNSSDLVTAAAFTGSNNSVDTTTNVGGATAATSYTTVGSFNVTLQNNLDTLQGQITLTNSVAPSGTFQQYAAGASGWTNSAYAEGAPDGNFATYVIPKNGTSANLLPTYNFSIPSDHTILGIQLDLTRKEAGSGECRDCTISLGRGSNKAVANTWPTSATNYTYGGSTDLWGTTWTPAQINAIAPQIAAEEIGGDYSITAYVDSVGLTVYTSGGTFTAKGRIRIGSNYGTEVSLSGAGPTTGTSVITAPTSGAQTVIVEAEVTYAYGGSVNAEFALVTSTPLSGSMLT